MDAYEIIARLRRAGYRQIDVAQKAQVTQGYLSQIMHNPVPNTETVRRVRETIAELLGVPVESVFGDSADKESEVA